MPLKQTPYLRLVHKDQKLPPFSTVAPQGSLFPEARPNTMVFVYTPAVGTTVLELLFDIRPEWLLDVRPAPRFDIFGHGRERVFALFEKLKLRYIDVAGVLGVSSYRTAAMNAAFVSETVTSLKAPEENSLKGPIVVLVDDLDYLHHIADLMPRCLRPPAKRGWETVQLLGPYHR